MYKYVQICTNMYKYAQICTICTNMYKYVHEIFKVSLPERYTPQKLICLCICINRLRESPSSIGINCLL